jgi:hypothetical protein
LDKARPTLPSGPTSGQSGHRAVPARERAPHPSAVAPGDPPSTFWVARRSARPERFTGIDQRCASRDVKFWLRPAYACWPPSVSTESGTEPRTHDRLRGDLAAATGEDLMNVLQTGSVVARLARAR